LIKAKINAAAQTKGTTGCCRWRNETAEDKKFMLQLQENASAKRATEIVIKTKSGGAPYLVTANEVNFTLLPPLSQ
jgi:hypothetical protein